jgi:two-component system response regulator MtrA
MLTAKSDTDDEVHALNAGADDYLPKPIDQERLIARINASLRRITPETSEVVRIGPLELDVIGHEVRRGSERLSLTPLEFNLLLTLALKPKQVFTREMLLEQVWGYHYKADTRLVNVHVQRLRSKIEDDPDNPKIVTTVRGIGYKAGTGF